MTAVLIPAPDPLWSPAQRARLVRLCAAVVGDESAAEDLAQETLLTAWRLQHRLTDPGGADSWLNAIARNVCRRWLRARGSAPVPTADLGTGEARDLDSVLEREEVVELLDRALALLPAATRDALVGHYVEELSHAEIASRLGTSTDAVSMRVSRGRSRLRYLLETRFADDAVAEGWARRDDAGWHADPVALPRVRAQRYADAPRRDRGRLPLRVVRSRRACRPGCRSTPRRSARSWAAYDVRARSSRALAAWTHAYWDSPSPACVRCDRPVTAAALRPGGRRALVQPARLVRRVRRLRRGGQRLGVRARARDAGGARGPQARPAAAAAAGARRRPRRQPTPRSSASATATGAAVVSAVFLADSLRLVHVG